MNPFDLTYVPHIGWLAHEVNDDVGVFLRDGWFEYKEQAFFWLHLQGGDTLIDCGAQVGLYSVLGCEAMRGQGTVFAVEPNPRTIPLLRRNLKRNSTGCASPPAAPKVRLGSIVPPKR